MKMYSFASGPRSVSHVPRDSDDGSGVFEAYIRDLERFPPLRDPEREHELAVRTRAGDASAREQFINANLRMVVPIARAFASSNPDVPLMDVIQEGNTGLIRAVDLFDPDRGLRFSTYATWWVRKYCQEATERKVGRVRTVSLNRALRTRAPDDSGRIDSEANTLEDVLEDPNANTQVMDAQVFAQEAATHLYTLMATVLSERERTVLMWRYGLGEGHGDGMTLEQVGKRIKKGKRNVKPGVSREWVSKIEQEALAKLRAALQEGGQQKVDGVAA